MSVIKKQHIYLPKQHLDYSKWAVIACDQFINDQKYWQRVKNYVEGSPTTLDMIFPEIYLSADSSSLIRQKIRNMQTYNKNEILEDAGVCMVLTNRSTREHPSSLGIMLNIDLEAYDPKVENTLIRVAKKPSTGKLKPLLELRKNAIFEFSHIIVLYDDREQKIAENLFDNRNNLECIYDFNLNMGGGHLTGWKIINVKDIIEKFDKLLDPTYLHNNFHTDLPLLFIVGEGDRSLLTAKEHWDNIKTRLSEEERSAHPARYALVRAVNVHDSGIVFHAIHRVVHNAGGNFVKRLKKFVKSIKKTSGGVTKEKIFIGKKEEPLVAPINSLEYIKLVQDFLDEYLVNKLEMSIDYVYSLGELKKICEKDKNAIGISFPVIDRERLFEFVIKHGALPRKAFSIGNPTSKPYYFEAHKIRLI